jgi:two-component sensor histidine kinase
MVRAQLAHFADLLGSRHRRAQPGARLKAACAQAVGLAPHELATNAGKYGELSTDKGRLHITTEWGGPPYLHPSVAGAAPEPRKPWRAGRAKAAA